MPTHHPPRRCRQDLRPGDDASRMNKAKGAKIGVRQQQLAEKWRKAGLLSDAGFQAVMAGIKKKP